MPLSVDSSKRHQKTRVKEVVSVPPNWDTPFDLWGSSIEDMPVSSYDSGVHLRYPPLKMDQWEFVRATTSRNLGISTTAAMRSG